MNGRIARALRAELGFAQRRARATAETYAAFRNAGVALDAFLRAGELGIAAALAENFDGDRGLFRFAAEGERAVEAWVMGVWDGFFDCAGTERPDVFDSPARGWPGPSLIDLVAWRPEAPARWRLRLGHAEWLNPAAVRAAQTEALDELARPRPPLRLYPHPHAWLLDGARRDGAVLLELPDWRALRDLLAGVPRVIVPDAAFAEIVYRELRRRRPEPKIPEVIVDRVAPRDPAESRT